MKVIVLITIFTVYLITGLVSAEVEFLGGKYQIVKADPSTVRIVWKDDEGEILRTFPRALQYLEKRGETVKLLMNGGIYEKGEHPSGLLIQEGKILRPSNKRTGKGNFYLKPNGIFYLSDNRANIVKTEEFQLKDDVRYAVQSGPLLLNDGVIHPAFREHSTSRLHRNGIGVTSDGEVILAMSSKESQVLPNLYTFAQLFKSMDCEDALFLDGVISEMALGIELKEKGGKAFASIVAVVEK